MAHTRRAGLLAAALITIAACTGAAPPAEGAAQAGPRLTDPRPCPELTDVTCSDLVVPLDRSGKQPGTLKLQVATGNNTDAPRGVLLLLTGGPGQPGVEFYKSMAERLPKAVKDYRLVMIDQRGTGGTAVDCPTLQKEVGGSDTTPPSRAAVDECAQLLGKNRNFYRTADTVADFEDLRRALKVPSMTLDGVSYGTFTAAQYGLTYPRHTKRLVLDSVVPSDGAGALYEDSLHHARTVLRTACKEQACGFDPAKDLAEVVRRDDNGVPVFGMLVVASIIDPKLNNPNFRILDAIHSAAGGDTAHLNGLVAGFNDPSGTPPAKFSAGLHAATLCADTRFPWGGASAPVAGREQALRKAVQGIKPSYTWPFERKTAGEQGIPQTCLPWPRSVPNPAPPHTKLTMPVLLLHGDRDLSTPVVWAEELAAKTPKGELAVIEGAGHSVQRRSDAGARAAEAFLLR
ncbi:alpha/beta fold hydrolase [Streptomyces sp. TRM66268-LWL]|uniref:Alpha/beta fold hydrolase n=1 Tax=Streptomyces polyasparticus TaxID=2767826 RepID=A0ABR7SAL9_9ACTN|nr:alpha/beta hydrolase [Streptomyces polyasparticus]MBC9712049.1 alpha/beta fold hydrolase [Streptomyces polyasparticus]